MVSVKWSGQIQLVMVCFAGLLAACSSSDDIVTSPVVNETIATVSSDTQVAVSTTAAVSPATTALAASTTQQVTLSRGPTADGATGCAGAGCTYFLISASGFESSTALTVECFVDGAFFYSFEATTNAAGSYETATFCYADTASYETAEVIVGGVRSGEVPW